MTLSPSPRKTLQNRGIVPSSMFRSPAWPGGCYSVWRSLRLPATTGHRGSVTWAQCMVALHVGGVGDGQHEQRHRSVRSLPCSTSMGQHEQRRSACLSMELPTGWGRTTRAEPPRNAHRCSPCNLKLICWHASRHLRICTGETIVSPTT
jgi:hypothetical protein